MKPAIIGCRTDNFTDEQLAIFAQHQPFGMIIFAEPFKVGPQAVTHVIEQFRSVCPHAKILIDMEGGRVNRMKPEFNHGWRTIPGARDFNSLLKSDINKGLEAIVLNAQIIADDMNVFGIDVNCAPVVDLVHEDVMSNLDGDRKPHATSASLYQRSFSHDPQIVTQAGKAFADGLHSMGVTSILKHAPGYGRIAIDPHYGVASIDVSWEEMLATDLVPYRQMKDCPAIMTAHTIYPQIDHVPATLSAKLLSKLRKDVGFEGVIIADSIEMNSVYPAGFSTTEFDQFGIGLPLAGTIKHVTQHVLAAGCDLALHSDCSRNFDHTVEMLEAAPALDDTRAAWLLNKMTVARTANQFDRAGALLKLDKLLASL